MRVAVLTLAAVVTASSLVSAQWPAYRTAAAPRLPNGESDFNAPAPRTGDGKPDLSGTWMMPETFLKFGGIFDLNHRTLEHLVK